MIQKMCKTRNVRNYDSGKVAKFQDAKVSGFGINLKKTQGGVESTPPQADQGGLKNIGVWSIF